MARKPVPVEATRRWRCVSTQSRSRESTEALLEIGEHLIEQRGVDDCSMNEVAAAAGSSVGALYFRFGNRGGS